MEIKLTNVGKRFNREWIFRNFNYSFNTSKKYAITGPNGSGKSTLLQVIAGATMHNEGIIDYTIDHQKIEPEQHFKLISIAAPYLELIEEMTAKEILFFQSSFKPLLQSVSIADILETVGLQTATNKQLRYFSSGMKQRLKLAQAFFSNTPILLLDEPTTNLDTDGIELYQTLLNNYTKNRLVIISSNVKQEYDFCDEVISIQAYK
ncbi:MAG: ABC transporter ATP-binding protein [Ferruginibacter sp.]|nr:ABC transporter ATP-binding protein [Ferruginibacter sp.]